MVHVRRDGDVRRRLDAQGQRACPRRPGLRQRVSERTRTWIDLLGGIFFLVPLCVLLIYFTWPWFWTSWHTSEISTNAGGLLRWPVKLRHAASASRWSLLQGISEIIKCIARAHDRTTCASTPTRSRCNDRVRRAQHGAADVRGADRLFMLIGYPAAFSLARRRPVLRPHRHRARPDQPDFLGNLTFQLFGVISNDLLLAIPFFTLMGAILERCGLAEDLLEGFGQLFGGVRGGLSYAVILVGAVLGAITGTVAASVIAMGLISLPVMLRYGYSVRHATGVIAASGTITQLIPPSLVLIVLADQLGRSVGDMYLGRDRPEHHPGRAVLRLGAHPQRSSARRMSRRCRPRRARCGAGR